ncbi:MAG: hypothetical protein VX834_02235 [Myxococcota bacterium]|nr:hypothetical protein [Myxococcota bacterium]
MKRYYLSYCDRNYLVRLVALARSLFTHEPKGTELIVICFDELTRLLLEGLNIEGLSTIALHTIEHGDHELLSKRRLRSPTEYYWTMTPTLLLRVLERRPEIDVLTYTDADTLFFSRADAIYDELASNSVLIHEHRYQASLAKLDNQAGRFNVGLMCFRNDSEGLATLGWWRRACLDWCYARFEDNKFGDQKYLEAFPDRVTALQVLQYPGAGTAPWNHENYRYSRGPSGDVYIDDVPLVHYHFHGLSLCSPTSFIAFRYSYPVTDEVLREIYVPYIEALRRSMRELQAVLPGFDAGMTEPVATGAGGRPLLIHADAMPSFSAQYPILDAHPLTPDWRRVFIAAPAAS